jgi:hypothetical protein
MSNLESYSMMNVNPSQLHVKFRTSLDKFRSTYLATPFSKGVVVGESTIDESGLGVFAGRSYAANEPITEYYGEVLAYEDAKLRKNSSHIRSLATMRWVIDGLYHNSISHEAIHMDNSNTQKHGVGAFINTHSTLEGNNCTYDVYDSCNQHVDPFLIDPFERIVYIKSMRAILKHEELFCNYGKMYWKSKRNYKVKSYPTCKRNND